MLKKPNNYSMHIAIIGNGISGITTARYLRKLDPNARVTVISSETDHFFSRTALMYIYMGHMGFKETKPYEDYFWDKNRIDLKNAHIQRIDFNEKMLHTQTNEQISYDKLVLALGSSPNKFGWPGQDLKGVGGLYFYQDLERMEQYSKGLQRAVIVGGGLIGIEMAEMFHSRHIPVTFLVRETNYWNAVLPEEESKMVSREIIKNGIDLRLETELKEILDNGNGTCKAAVTNKGETIECGFVGLTAGVHPNVKWLKDTELEINRGIKVNAYLETNIPGVYAVGDCAEQQDVQAGRRPIEAIWYTGRMMGEICAYNIMGKQKSYDPGIWFNSAKFMDIEYQVYGAVSGRPPEHHASLYWEHEEGNKSVRIVYDKNTNEVVGFNLMGVRFRHEVCEKWLREKTDMKTVLSQLKLAEFDPEFYPSFAEPIISAYNKQTGSSVRSTASRKWNQVFSFLHKA